MACRLGWFLRIARPTCFAIQLEQDANENYPHLINQVQLGQLSFSTDKV